MAPRKGFRHSPESIEKIRAAAKRNGVSPQCRTASVASRKGKPSPVSEEGRARQRAAVRVAMLGNKNARRVYETAEEARLALNARARDKHKREPEYFREVQRRWRERNRARKKEHSAAYAERHKERINAKQREKNKDPKRKAFIAGYLRNHRAANPELYLSYVHARRAKRLAAGGVHTKEEWAAKLEEYGHRCVYCCSGGRMTRDHVVPLSKGGTNDISNIAPACRRCNSSKHDLTAQEYMSRLEANGSGDAHHTGLAQ